MPNRQVEDTPSTNSFSESAITEGRLRRYLKRVTTDPAVCHGEPCIRGTRIMVRVIFSSVKGGMSHDDILLRYPDLTRDDIEAAMIYSRR